METGHWQEGQTGPQLTQWAAALGWPFLLPVYPLLGLVQAKVLLLRALWCPPWPGPCVSQGHVSPSQQLVLVCVVSTRRSYGSS